MTSPPLRLFGRFGRLRVAALAVAALAIPLTMSSAPASAAVPQTAAAPHLAKASATPTSPQLTVVKHHLPHRLVTRTMADGRPICIITERWKFTMKGASAKQSGLAMYRIQQNLFRVKRVLAATSLDPKEHPGLSPLEKFRKGKSPAPLTKRVTQFRGLQVQDNGEALLQLQAPGVHCKHYRAVESREIVKAGPKVSELTLSWWKAAVAETAGSLTYTLVYAATMAFVAFVAPELTAANPWWLFAMSGCLGGATGRLVYNELIGMKLVPNLVGSATACFYAAFEQATFATLAERLRSWIQNARLLRDVESAVESASHRGRQLEMYIVDQFEQVEAWLKACEQAGRWKPGSSLPGRSPS